MAFPIVFQKIIWIKRVFTVWYGFYDIGDLMIVVFKKYHLVKGEDMGYKKWGKEVSFADLAISKSLEHNRSLKMMERINKVVSWKNIEAVLREYYGIGTSKGGADAYPPLMLLLPARREVYVASKMVPHPARRGEPTRRRASLLILS